MIKFKKSKSSSSCISLANPKSRIRRLFSHPSEAMQDGDREEILYVACSPTNLEESKGHPDVLITLDVQSDSDTYGKVTFLPPIFRLFQWRSYEGGKGHMPLPRFTLEWWK